MRMAMRPRYYCDHCKKGSGSASAMKKHEERCTNSPVRVCGACGLFHLKQKPIGELIAALGSGDEAGMKALRELADGCPACIFAAIRQSKLNVIEYDEGGIQRVKACLDFDFKKELKDWMDEYNANREPQYGYDY